ncbi:MAG: hypothetical protein NC417_10195 [Candidatus Gastranaerophilales bacterium]|nr:hypothetical protein [Candidatus Gastranaerophilales bacterium]
MMKKQDRAKLAGRVKRVAAAVLAGCMLYCGGTQANAATLEDVFDEHYYADMYPDLKEAYGYDKGALWQHFMKYGLSEGRNMNGLIDIVKYREMYGDLNAAFGNNWNAYLNHYLTFGAKENRETGTDFNALDYAGRYADLQAAYGTDVLALWSHYQAFGATEGREARDEDIVQAEEAAAREEDIVQAEEAVAREENSGRTERIDYADGSWIINEYDSGDTRVKTTYYDKNGNCTKWVVYEGSKSIWYKADGTVDYSVVRENYDSGNSKRETIYNADGSTRRIREYFDVSGKYLSKDTYYGENGKVSSVYEYDNDMNGAYTATFYHADGSYSVTVRDKDGNFTYKNYNADGTEK